MTNVQLLLSIGIPSLLIVLSWLSNNSRFARVEKRLDAHDRRFEDMQHSFNARFDGVIAAIHGDTLEIMRAMTALHERVAVVEARQNR